MTLHDVRANRWAEMIRTARYVVGNTGKPGPKVGPGQDWSTQDDPRDVEGSKLPPHEHPTHVHGVGGGGRVPPWKPDADADSIPPTPKWHSLEMWHAIHEYKRQELQIRHMRWRTAGAWVAVAIALMALAKPEIVTLWKGLVAVSEGKSIPQPGPALPKTEPEKRTSLPNEQQNKARVERNRVRLHNHVDALPRFSLLSPIADNVETPPTLAFSYRQFLDDVRYVISIGEWKQFVALSSDSARDRFIEQFWERRNPIPGTPSNRYRDEHYRRLAYADREFRYKDVPGRRTFRGWMYILNGKPDVREVHPGGTNAPSGAESAGLPAEIWRYHVQGPGDDITFEFIDANRDGTFPLVTPPNARVLLPEEEKK